MTLGILVASILSLASTANAGAQTRAVRIDTLPPVAGAKITVDDNVFVTDSAGVATILLPTLSTKRDVRSGIRSGLPEGLVKFQAVNRTAKDTRAEFNRFYGETAVFDIYKRVSLQFKQSGSGEPVDPKDITSVSLKASTGTVQTISRKELLHPGYLWLPSRRVVPLNGGLETKPIVWSIQSVMLDGSNVVNRSQTRFVPGRGGNPEIPLLFFSTSFSSSDAFFGFSLGSGVQLHYPNGEVKTLDFGDDGTASPPPLPRGDYEISVNGPGFSFTRPVSVSRDQEIKLKVFSYLDILFLLGALMAMAIGLPLARRPGIRARIRAWVAGLPGVGALPGIRIPIPSTTRPGSAAARGSGPPAMPHVNGVPQNGTARAKSSSTSPPSDPLEALALAVEERERLQPESARIPERNSVKNREPKEAGDPTDESLSEDRSNGSHRTPAET